MEILNMDQLKRVLTDLESIEMQAIRVMGTIRDPRYSRDSQLIFNTLLDIQIKIRDFREALSKNSGDFSIAHYHDFVAFAHSTFNQYHPHAMQPAGYQT